MARKIIIAFYASSRFGSEYRAGIDFITFAAAHGFDLAVIANLEQNDDAPSLTRSTGIAVEIVPSVVRRQKLLYRFTDTVPQILWHRRVARWLQQQHPEAEIVWVQNGALPWLPLTPYFDTAPKIVWGPVGGGETPNAAVLQRLNRGDQLRERLRELVAELGLKLKSRALRGHAALQLVPLARTGAASSGLARKFTAHAVPVIPEILRPIAAAIIPRTPGGTPRFVWVGQDIPRKNLELALQLFSQLRQRFFQDATLDIYGVKEGAQAVAAVRYHGWVSSIDWSDYRNCGILLLTSFREGLPSVVLEAASQGLLCLCSDVGALSSLKLPNIYVLPRTEYPDFSPSTVDAMAHQVKSHLALNVVALPLRDYRTDLSNCLQQAGIIQ